MGSKRTTSEKQRKVVEKRARSEDEGASRASGDGINGNIDREESSKDDGDDDNDDEEEEEGEEEEDNDDDDDDDDDEIEEEEEEDIPRKKKPKMSKHDDGSAGFSDAMNAILSSHLKAYDRDNPIMARNKKILKKTESDRLERQAKRELLVEKKKKLNRVRRKDVIPRVTDDSDEKTGEEIRNILEKEARLRKIARKGAVKLFNAILSTQVGVERDSKTIVNIGQKEKKQRITDLSKEKFLDMVKAAGENE